MLRVSLPMWSCSRCVPIRKCGGNYYHRRLRAACRRRVGGLWSQNPPCLASELAVSRWVGAQTVVHFGGNWRKWAVLAEVDCALGEWGAEVSRRGWDAGRIRMRCAPGFARGPGFALRARATAC